MHSPCGIHTTGIRSNSERPAASPWQGESFSTVGTSHAARRLRSTAFVVTILSMRIIYLSPHLDDAILTAGGLIHDQIARRMRVEIWTLMAGVPASQELSDFASKMHAEWGTTTARQTVRLRRLEDRNAAHAVGARPVHLEFLDCIYRRDAGGQPLYSEALYTPIHPCDSRLPAQIAGDLRRRLRDDDIVVCQLGIGGHVDHRLVRDAAQMLPRPLRYAADLPYLLNHPEELAPSTASLQSSLEPVSDAGLAAWLGAIEAYRSQLSTLFDSLESMRERLRAYWSEGRGIRLWSSGSAASTGA